MSQAALITPLILAGGASSRFGRCKLLLDINGRSLLQHSVDRLSEAGLPMPLIVSGAWHELLLETHPHLNFIENKNWQAGIGSSISLGVRSLPETCRAVLISLADQPAIRTADICNLLDSWAVHQEIVCSTYTDKKSVPAVFSEKYFPQLVRLSGEQGARDILRSQHNNVIGIPVPGGALDIDTEQDWQAYGESQCS